MHYFFKCLYQTLSLSLKTSIDPVQPFLFMALSSVECLLSGSKVATRKFVDWGGFQLQLPGKIRRVKGASCWVLDLYAKHAPTWQLCYFPSARLVRSYCWKQI